MTHAKATIIIVLPLFNNGEDLADIVTAIKNNIPPKCNFEFLLVNDGSVDATEDTMVALTAKDPRKRVFHSIGILDIRPHYAQA